MDGFEKYDAFRRRKARGGVGSAHDLYERFMDERWDAFERAREILDDDDADPIDAAEHVLDEMRDEYGIDDGALEAKLMEMIIAGLT